MAKIYLVERNSSQDFILAEEVYKSEVSTRIIKNKLVDLLKKTKGFNCISTNELTNLVFDNDCITTEAGKQYLVITPENELSLRDNAKRGLSELDLGSRVKTIYPDNYFIDKEERAYHGEKQLAGKIGILFDFKKHFVSGEGYKFLVYIAYTEGHILSQSVDLEKIDFL